jgi:anaerobic magnesium-protoporphyrin IX monomethyl ester cyclase
MLNLAIPFCLFRQLLIFLGFFPAFHDSLVFIAHRIVIFNNGCPFCKASHSGIISFRGIVQMKVQFVFAAPTKMPRFGEMGEKVSPPLGMLYLAAYLREKVSGLDIRAIDAPRKGFYFALDRINQFNPDVLCVSYYTVSALGAYEMISMLKKKNPNLLVVVGGHHVTALPGEALARSKADIEVYSEGELTLVEIVREYIKKGHLSRMSLGRILGIGFLHKGKHTITQPRPFIDDLDSIPFPARDLIDLGEYNGWFVARQNPQARVIFSRGCPYRCTFCSNKVWNRQGSRVRVRSPKNIADELEMLKEKYGVREFFDDADELNNNVPNAIAICKEIAGRKLGMTWKCQLRCNNLPEELVKAMAEAGCWYVHLGIESGNQLTLNGIRKGITLKQAVDACKLLSKYKIKVLALFMLFNAWEENGKLVFEGVKETQNTLDFAQMLLRNKWANFIGATHTQPYPGSELFEIALRHGIMKPHMNGNWDSWLRDDMFIMQLPGIPETDMARLRSKGNLIIARQLLASGDIRPRDIIYFAQKGLKLVEDNVKALLR